VANPIQVAVTGASGYIALHVIAALLDQGYAVRGTLRDMARGEKIRAALAKHTEVTGLSFAESDLMSDQGWDAALADCQYVMHVASPFPVLDPKNHDDLIIPARDGALRVLAAAARADVQRVVMTSSAAAIGNGHGDKSSFTEADWSVVSEEIGAYNSSKTIAERAAWDFVASLPEGEAPELVMINPSLVLGPLIDPDGSASTELVRKLLAREVPGCPKMGFPLVDVRDVAAAHLAAMTSPDAAGKRYICSTEFKMMVDVAEHLNRTFGPGGHPVRTRELPNWLVRIVALLDPTVRRVVPELGREKHFDNAAIRKDLNWQPRPMDETIAQTGESLIALGIIK
jgi:nucleoside-diphosphate-sugar epimerase